jgi:Ca2+-binding EF-hand superfamily protein
MLGISSSTGVYGSTESFTEMAAKMLKKTDTNGDGNIDINEFQAGAPQGPPQGASEGRPKDAPDLKELFSKADSDGDGNLTEAEFTDFLKQMGDGHGKPPAKSAYDTTSTDDTESSLISELYAASQDMADGSISKDAFIKVIAELMKDAQNQGSSYNVSGQEHKNSGSSLVDQKV